MNFVPRIVRNSGLSIACYSAIAALALQFSVAAVAAAKGEEIVAIVVIIWLLFAGIDNNP